MRLVTAFAFVCLALAGPAFGADSTAAAFGAREYVQQVSLSPDGQQVAMIVPSPGRGAKLVTINIGTGASKTILVASGEPERLTQCRWSTNTRLVCQIYAIIKSTDGKLGYTRLLALNSDGGDLKMLTAEGNGRTLGVAQDGGVVIDWSIDDAQGGVLMTREYLPETGRKFTTQEGLGVERVDTLNLVRLAVEKPFPTAVEYIGDGRGAVRIMGLRSTRANSGYVSNRISYLYRQENSREWLPLGQVKVGSVGYSGFDPYAVDPKLNVAYGFDDKDGRQALYKVALDGSMTRDLVLARPDVDVSGLVRIGRQNRVVGASFVTDRRETEFFDPELRKLGQAIGKAMPGRIVTFVDASADESKLLLFVGGDSYPGVYYLFDKTTRKLQDLAAARPQLEGMKLATVKAVTYPAADGTQIPGYLTLPPGSDGKNLPAIVMPHGGPSARDEWGFDWLAQYFAQRGYAVLQPNYRGSSGYGADWFQKNGFQSWRTAVGDVNDGGRWLEQQGVAAPGKMAIVGWSYGGYAALQSGVLDPNLFKAVVAIAPVTDLETLRAEHLNFTNYLQVSEFIGKGPHVAEGSPAQNAAAIKAPVLLFHGDLDANVGIGESRLMERKLRDAGRKVELIEFKGLDHHLSDDTARTEMLSKSDAFLKASLGL
jgi:dienelactone hydrolase